MLEVQNYLRSGKTLQELESEFGIKCVIHQSDPLVIVNYSLIDSPKFNSLVAECRGLVLEDKTWEIVARSFPRFFNQGECLEEEKRFDWANFVAEEKVDGSMMLLYNYKGEWRVNTRGSFAQGEICSSLNKTWADMFWSCINKEAINLNFCPWSTYVFEFCSPYNKVVRYYDRPQLFLLTAFRNDFGMEHKDLLLDKLACEFGIGRPMRYNLSSLEDIVKFLDEHPDPTFEGVVLRDHTGKRIKRKNARYVALHHLKGNGNIFLPKNLLPLVMKGEYAEVINYFGESAEKVFELVGWVAGHKARCKAVWEVGRGIASQKEYAEYVLRHCKKLSGILFESRKHGDFEKAWSAKAEDMLLRNLE